MGVNNKHAKRKFDNTMPTPDEGWWESVLAEEMRHAVPRVQPAPVNVKPATQESVRPVQTPEAARPDWDQIRDLHVSDRIIAMKVIGHNRGGLLVESDSIAGFVPFSHLVDLAGKDLETDRDASLEAYTGKTLNVKVIECVPEDGRIVFSERAALAEPGRRTEMFQTLQLGSQVRGTVTNITDFGVFVDLGGVEGLIHISELSWGRVLHPSQVVQLGQQIDVQVLELSVERCRIALSLKRMSQNPWERAATDFPEDRMLSAVVTSVLSYGAFARIEAGVEGLIHASEMPLEPHQTPREILKEGQSIQVRVLHVDPFHQRMGLSMHLKH